MGKYGYKITLTEEAYMNFKKVKEVLGAKSWEDLSRKLVEMVASSKASAGKTEASTGKIVRTVETDVAPELLPSNISPSGLVVVSEFTGEKVRIPSKFVSAYRKWKKSGLPPERLIEQAVQALGCREEEAWEWFYFLERKHGVV